MGGQVAEQRRSPLRQELALFRAQGFLVGGRGAQVPSHSCNPPAGEAGSWNNQRPNGMSGVQRPELFSAEKTSKPR